MSDGDYSSPGQNYSAVEIIHLKAEENPPSTPTITIAQNPTSEGSIAHRGATYVVMLFSTQHLSGQFSDEILLRPRDGDQLAKCLPGIYEEPR